MRSMRQHHQRTTEGATEMNIIERTPATNAEKPKTPQFFLFRQNNSGGSFDVNDAVAHSVIIEAYSVKDANARAEDVGIYFNGCDTGADCFCCGDRWYEAQDHDGTDTPLIYGEPPETHREMFVKEGQPVCHVYRLDGSKTTYRKPVKEQQKC
jgi:hypothetical protein